MEKVDLKVFLRKSNFYKAVFKKFLKKLETNPPKKFLSTMQEVDKEVWKEIDCLSCANCCKTMTPTFTEDDITRIANHLNITKDTFKNKWLNYQKKDKDWVNKKQPCQFLNLKTNMCNIYEVRPVDCAGFPHFTKKQPQLYMHVHQQNISYCPATLKMVEKLVERVG